MAFSTQKDFFHVPFMNENVEYECKKASVELKSYDSSIDERSWSRDETKKSKFLTDLVTCQLPVDGFSKVGSDGDRTTGATSVPFSTGVVPSTIHKVDDNVCSRYTKKGDSTTVFTGRDNFTFQLDGLTAGDSLLECANHHLTDYQKMMDIKDSLEQQLDVSNERLKIATEENQMIKEILVANVDVHSTNDFHIKVQKLIAAGKLTKNEENEMLQISQKMEKFRKAYEVLQAENNYLKRLIEKLSSRVSMNNINIEPETSVDVNYLQKEVNTLRKECTLLRSMEDTYHKWKKDSVKDGMSDQHAENINAIIKERNSLREKCRSLKDLQKTVVELELKYKESEKKYEESDRANSSMSSNLNVQESIIKDKDCKLKKMQKYYEDLLQRACFTEQCLKKQLEDLKDDLVRCQCKAQKADKLQTENACLRTEVLNSHLALSDCECQYKQLMEVVNELHAVKLQYLQDNHTQTCTNQIDDLAFFTCATLEEIMKELKKKGCIREEFDSEYPAARDEEIARLQNDMEDIKRERDSMCSDTLKRLKSLEEENSDLLNENSRMRKMMKEGEEKMVNMLKKIEHLDNESNRNGDDLKKSYHEMAETKKLVEDISSIQLQNQQLANAVGVLNSRDDEKVIEDLRRQLEQEMTKLKKCQLENVDLLKQAGERENELKTFKDLTNGLQKDINRLEVNNKKLMEDKDSLLKEVENCKKDSGAGNVQKGYINDDDNHEINRYNTDDKDTPAEANPAYTNFANSKLYFNKGLEKELRKIMDTYKRECDLSRLVNYKSKLYAICHKLCNCGIHKLSFRELAYLHKKIYGQAEKLLPGCLLNIILTDHSEEAQDLLNMNLPADACSVMRTDMLQKCCSCRKNLCCNKSEEMLEEKVSKLENDIKIARECLETLRTNTSQFDLTEFAENNDSTYRAVSPVQKICTKQVKTRKTRLLRNPEL